MAKRTLRFPVEAKQMIKMATRMRRHSLSQFVRESALAEAEIVLGSRSRFELDAERWTAFMTALDAPPQDVPGLRRLFEHPSLFESVKG